MPQPLFSLSGILIFISLDGYSVTQILCPELGTGNFRGSRLHALQQEESKTKYFQEASSLSSNCCPIHFATCLQILLSLLPGRVSDNHAVITSTSWLQFILLLGVQAAHSHLPVSESELCIFAVYSLLILL